MFAGCAAESSSRPDTAASRPNTSMSQRSFSCNSRRLGFSDYNYISSPLMAGVDVVRIIMGMTVKQVYAVYNRYTRLLNPSMDATAFAITFDELCFMFGLVDAKELAKSQIKAAEALYNPGDNANFSRDDKPSHCSPSLAESNFTGGTFSLSIKHPEHPLHHLLHLDSLPAEEECDRTSLPRTRDGLLPPASHRRPDHFDHHADQFEHGADALRALFNHMKKANHKVDVFELLAGAAILCTAPNVYSKQLGEPDCATQIGGNEAKLELLFSMFDFDHAGELVEDELAFLIASLGSCLAKLQLMPSSHQGELGARGDVPPSDEEVEWVVAEAFMDEACFSRGSMSLPVFIQWVLNNSLPLALLETLACIPRLDLIVGTLESKVADYEAQIKADRPDDTVKQLQDRTVDNNTVILGPIIGRVTSDSAAVLLEVGQNCAVTAHAYRLIKRDEDVGEIDVTQLKDQTSAGKTGYALDSNYADVAISDEELCRFQTGTATRSAGQDAKEMLGEGVLILEKRPQSSCTLNMVAMNPAVFMFSQLTPDTHYQVVFSGISAEAQQSQVGHFTTFTEHRACPFSGEVYQKWPRCDRVTMQGMFLKYNEDRQSMAVDDESPPVQVLSMIFIRSLTVASFNNDSMRGVIHAAFKRGVAAALACLPSQVSILSVENKRARVGRRRHGQLGISVRYAVALEKMVDTPPVDVPTADLDNYLLDIPGVSQTKSTHEKKVAISDQEQCFPRRGSNVQLILNRENERDFVKTQLNTDDRSQVSAAANNHFTATHRLSVPRKNLVSLDMRNSSVHRDNRINMNYGKAGKILQNHQPQVENPTISFNSSTATSSVLISDLASGKDAEKIDDHDPTHASLMRTARAMVNTIKLHTYAFVRKIAAELQNAGMPAGAGLFIDPYDVEILCKDRQGKVLCRGCGSLFDSNEHLNDCLRKAKTKDANSKEFITVAILNGDAPSELTEGVSNLWELLAGNDLDFDTTMYLDGRFATPDLLVHMHGLVQPLEVLEECMNILQQRSNNEYDAGRKDDESDTHGRKISSETEDRVLARLADTYRLAWTLPHTREVLACTPSVILQPSREEQEAMQWTTVPIDHPLHPNSAAISQNGEDIGEIRRVLQRLMFQVQNDYQFQQWGPVPRTYEEHRALQFQTRFQQFGKMGILVVNPNDSLFRSSCASEGIGDDTEVLQRQPDQQQDEQSNWQKFWDEESQVVYYQHKLTKETKWENPEVRIQFGAVMQRRKLVTHACSSDKHGTKLINEAHWDFLEDCLKCESIRVLVVVSHAPFVWDPFGSRADLENIRKHDDKIREDRDEKFRAQRSQRLEKKIHSSLLLLQEAQEAASAAVDTLKQYPELQKQDRFSMLKSTQDEYEATRQYWSEQVTQTEKAAAAAQQAHQVLQSKLEEWALQRRENTEAHMLASSEYKLRPVQKRGVNENIIKPTADDDLPCKAGGEKQDAWGRNEQELLKLLQRLLVWREEGVDRGLNREVILISDGRGIGVETVLQRRGRRQQNKPESKDQVKSAGTENSNTSSKCDAGKLQQFVVGPITAHPHATRLKLNGEVGSFRFNHKPLLGLRHFAAVQMAIDAGHARVNAALVPTPEDRVHATVGPIVGLVTATTANILLEVDLQQVVRCVLTDTFQPNQRFVETCNMDAKRPKVFQFTCLHPEHTYRIEFKGISNSSQRTGMLQTPSLHPPGLRIIAMAHEKPQKFIRPPGGRNLWDSLWGSARSTRFGCDVVLHLGCQVDATVAYDQSRCLNERLLQEWQNAGEMPLSEKELHARDEATRERLRDVYRFNFNVPSTREFLSRGSHLMVVSDSDVCGHFWRADALENVSAIQKLAREVSQEYQRQLYDPHCTISSVRQASMELLDTQESAHIPKGSDCALGFPPGFHFQRWGDCGMLFLDMKHLRNNDRGAPKQCANSNSSKNTHGQCRPGQSNGHARNISRSLGAHKGQIKQGHTLEETTILSAAQWQFIKEKLAAPNLHALIVITELPLVWHSPDTATKLFYSDSRYTDLQDHWAFHEHTLLRLLQLFFDWQQDGVTSLHTAAASVPLVSSKKTASAGHVPGGDYTGLGTSRKVLLLSGGARVGMTTTIRRLGTGGKPSPTPRSTKILTQDEDANRKTLMSPHCIQQLCVGPITDVVEDQQCWPVRTGVLGRSNLLSPSSQEYPPSMHFEYEHIPIGGGLAAERDYAVITASVNNVCPSFRWDFVVPNGQSHMAMATVGPIVGRVTADSAVVLLEVDCTLVVTGTAECMSGGTGLGMVTTIKPNTQGNEHRNEESQPEMAVPASVQVKLAMTAHIPRAFHFTGLKPESAYRISFDVLYRREGKTTLDSCAMLTTLSAVRQPQLTIVATTGNAHPGEMIQSILEPSTHSQSDVPYNHIDGAADQHKGQRNVVEKEWTRERARGWASVFSASQNVGGADTRENYTAALGPKAARADSLSAKGAKRPHSVIAAAEGAALHGPLGHLALNPWVSPWGAVQSQSATGVTSYPNVRADLMLHLGGQVSMNDAFESQEFEAASIVTAVTNDATAGAEEDNESQLMKESDWYDVEQEVLHRLRDRYRIAYAMPHVRAAFRHCPQLMLYHPDDLYQGMGRAAQIERHPLGHEILRRCARQVWREYQRQLWDPACLMRDPVAKDVDEQAFFHTGNMGVLFVDQITSRLRPDGTRLLEQRMLSDQQAEFIAKCFNTPGLLMLIVVSQYPLVWLSPAQMDAHVASSAFSDNGAKLGDSDTSAGGQLEARVDEVNKLQEVLLRDQWGWHEDLQAEMLENLFEWKALGTHNSTDPDALATDSAAPTPWGSSGCSIGGREVLLLSGNMKVGCETDISDPRTNSTIRQLVVAPGLDQPQSQVDFEPELTGMLHKRFLYTHTPAWKIGEDLLHWSGDNKRRDVDNTDGDAQKQIDSDRDAGHNKGIGDAERPGDKENNVYNENGTDNAMSTEPPRDGIVDDSSAEQKKHGENFKPSCVENASGLSDQAHSIIAHPLTHIHMQRNMGVIHLQLDTNTVECRAQLSGTTPRHPRGYPTITLGPVIGKMNAVHEILRQRSQATAHVLYEVSHRALVVCVLTDVLTAERFCEEAILDPLRAHVFRFTNLRPLRRYRINLERTENPRQFAGVLTTPSAAAKSKLNAVVVSGDRPSQLEEGEPSMWQALSRRLQEPWCGIDVVLHIGGQVALGPTARECLYYVLWCWGYTLTDEELGHGHQKDVPSVAQHTVEDQNGEDTALTGMNKQSMEKMKEEVRGRFRTQYRKQWNNPHKKAVLGCCSNIMMWSDKDIMEGWSWKEGGVIGAKYVGANKKAARSPSIVAAPSEFRTDEISKERQAQESLRTYERLRKARHKAGALVVSLARDVYHEYQRALWYEDFIVGADQRQAAKVRRRAARAERKRLAEMEENERQAYKVAKTEFEAKKKRELELEGYIDPPKLAPVSSLDADDSKTVMPCNRDKPASVGSGCRFGGSDSEYHFQRWGKVGIVFLDMHDYAHQMNCFSNVDGYHEGIHSNNPKVVAMFKELQVKLGGAAPQPLDEREQCCLSERQWRFLKKRVLRSGVRSLLVVSETPLIFMSREEGRSMEATMSRPIFEREGERPVSPEDLANSTGRPAQSPEDGQNDEKGDQDGDQAVTTVEGSKKTEQVEGKQSETGDIQTDKAKSRRRKKREYRPRSRAVQGHWIHRPKMVQELLALLYQWRDEEDGREVLLLGGGLGCGVETTVTDVSMQVDMFQVAVGPISDCCMNIQVALEGTMRKYTYSHLPVEQHNYALLQAEVTTTTETFEAGELAVNESLAEDAESLPSKLIEVCTETGSIKCNLVHHDNIDKQHIREKLVVLPDIFGEQDPVLWWDDAALLLAHETPGFQAINDYVWDSAEFEEQVHEAYYWYHFDDSTRAAETRTVDLASPEVVRQQLTRCILKLWRTAEESTKYSHTFLGKQALASAQTNNEDQSNDRTREADTLIDNAGLPHGMIYLPDAFVLGFTLLQMEVKGRLDFTRQPVGPKDFLDLMRDIWTEAANLSGAMLQREHQEAIILQKLEAEEQARLDAIAKENRRRQKAKELEAKLSDLRTAAEQGDEDALQEYQRIVREQKDKEDKERDKELKQAEKAKKKAEKEDRRLQKELLAKAEAEAEAKQAEVDELNALAEANPAEYDRRMAVKAEEDRQQAEEEEARRLKRKRLAEKQQDAKSAHNNENLCDTDDSDYD